MPLKLIPNISLFHAWFVEDFKVNIPKSPVKALYELKNDKVRKVPEECKTIKYETGMEAYKFTIEVEGTTFEAIGRSKDLAQYKVFKKAYRYFMKPK